MNTFMTQSELEAALRALRGASATPEVLAEVELPLEKPKPLTPLQLKRLRRKPYTRKKKPGRPKTQWKRKKMLTRKRHKRQADRIKALRDAEPWRYYKAKRGNKWEISEADWEKYVAPCWMPGAKVRRSPKGDTLGNLLITIGDGKHRKVLFDGRLVV